MTRLLTVREVAEHLSVSTETVLRWTRNGKLPSIRLPGGAVRVRASALELALEEWAAPARGVVNGPAGRHPAATLVNVNGPKHEE